MAVALVVVVGAGLVVAAGVAQFRSPPPQRKAAVRKLRRASAPLAAQKAAKVSRRPSSRPKAAKADPANVGAICARDLFKPPSNSALARSDASGPSRSFFPGPARSIRLSGVTFDGKELQALVENEVTGESWYVRRGEKVCGMTLEVIAQDHLILSDGKKRHRVDLLDPPPSQAFAPRSGKGPLPPMRIMLPLPALGAEREAP
jgi:hypothetical protein